ncbi:MAG: acetolactate decarboxylase [Kiritimatiellales bacterium]
MRLLILLILPALLVGCSTAPKDTLMQVSTIDALLAGVYDGQISVEQLLRYGNLGIGTFDALEGEMIVIDGKVYQARVDGTVKEMPKCTTTPFASVVQFSPDHSASINRLLSEQELLAKVDAMAPNRNLFAAVRFDGTFPSMKVRSVPKQDKPYPPLAEVTLHQAVFEYADITGTVLGFRCPAFVKGINVPEYHLHFISTDRSQGGHILDFTTGGGMLGVDSCSRFYMLLTDQKQFAAVDLGRDRSEELRKVEQ